MDIALFLRGVVMGVAIAAPVGPIGILCIRQTITYGWLTGLVSGLGAATADGIYGCIAGFGVSAISDLLFTHRPLLTTIGGLFLCYLGIKTFIAIPQSTGDFNKAGDGPDDHKYHRRSHFALLNAYGTTLALTLTNPATILSFTAIFAGLGMANYNNQGESAFILVSGVFVGSALWWLTLSSGIACFRRRFSVRAMSWLNRLSGSIITVFGIVAFFS